MNWFINNYVKSIPRDNLSVLDVGSLSENGSYRKLFQDLKCSYTGLDITDGPNVDFIPEVHYEWKELATDSFDVVISGQALEHCEFYWLIVAEMVRVLKKDGIMCIIAPRGFHQHRFPVDCWRFLADGMIALARFYCLKVEHAHTNAGPSCLNINWFSKNNSDSLLVARKTYAGVARQVDISTYKCQPADLVLSRDGFYQYPFDGSILSPLIEFASKKLNSL